MPRGNYRQVIKCAEQPCPEKVTYNHTTRADENASVKQQREYPWKCARHRKPDEVLSRGTETLSGTLIVTKRPEARSWESPMIWVGPGFPFVSDRISGPGFQAFASDWPEGTRIEITARILPPAGEPSGMQQPAPVVRVIEPHDDGTSYCTSLPLHDHDQPGETCPAYHFDDNGDRWPCIRPPVHNYPDGVAERVHIDQFGNEFRVGRCRRPAEHGMTRAWCAIPEHHKALPETASEASA